MPHAHAHSSQMLLFASPTLPRRGQIESNRIDPASVQFSSVFVKTRLDSTTGLSAALPYRPTTQIRYGSSAVTAAPVLVVVDTIAVALVLVLVHNDC